MKVNKLISIVFAITMFFGIINNAEAILMGPLSEGDFQTLNNPGADYGPPPAVGFPDGPTSVQSGEDVPLSYGPSPGQEGVDALLFVLSLDPSLLPALGVGTIEFSLDLEDPVLISSGDFISTEAAKFPNNIGGIGNGEVGGVKFPDAFHAGVVYDPDPFSGGSTGDDNGTLKITSPIWPLRVDIFSLDDFTAVISTNPGFEITRGTIIGNTPNSHALAVVPEPATMVLLGVGLIGFAAVGRKKFFKKK